MNIGSSAPTAIPGIVGDLHRILPTPALVLLATEDDTQKSMVHK